MRNSQGFDYKQPTRDALAGIYVEVSDSAAENPAAEPNMSPVPPQVDTLFGLTVTVDDENTAERSNRKA